MTNMIAQSLILLLAVGLNYGCGNLVKTNPSIMSGFKMSEEPAQKERDKTWIKLFLKNMQIANTVTLVGGLVGIVYDLHMIYYFSLILPITVVVILSYSHRKIEREGDGKKLTVVLAIGIIVCLPVWYAGRSNLEVTFPEGNMKIGGMYGKAIPLGDIKEAQICLSLPKISIRTNGFALGKTNIGHFRTTDGKGVMLFTHSDACFIRITMKNYATTYYLSCREEEETLQLFHNIQRKIENVK